MTAPSSPKYKMVRIREDVHTRLKGLGTVGDSISSVINQLITGQENRQEIIKWGYAMIRDKIEEIDRTYGNWEETENAIDGLIETIPATAPELKQYATHELDILREENEAYQDERRREWEEYEKEQISKLMEESKVITNDD